MSQNVLTRGRGYGMMGTSQIVTKSWNAQPDGRPGGPRKTRGGPEAPESLGKPRRAPGCKRPCPETGEALPGCLSGRRPASGGRHRDCRCTACGGQAPGLPVHGLRRAGAGIAGARPAEGRRPLSFRPRRKRAADRGGCGLAPVQGRLSASLKQVPGCLKGRCPATWVHERAEIAPNRAQRQRPAASGRSRGDCPQVQGQNTAAGRFFWSVNVTLCVFSTRTDCRRPFSGAGAGRASGGVVPTVPAAA